MSDPAPVAPVTPAPTQAVTPTVTPAPVTPASGAPPANPTAPVTPAPSGTPVTPSSEKSILDKAGKPDAPQTPSDLLDAANEAVAKWQANPTDETKATATKAVADAKKAAEDAKTANKAPDEYKFTAPEGVTLDEAAIKAFVPIAKELGLKQDQAQKLVALQATLVKQQADADAKAWTDYQASQIEATKKELGAKYDEELAYVAKVRDTFFSKEAQAVINQYGLGNNIHFLRDLISIGKKMSVEKHIEGGPGPQGGSDTAKRMFPSMQNP